MADAGLILLWLAVQDVLVVAPALLVRRWMGRRGPAAGAWAAAVGLAMVLLLASAPLWPRFDRGPGVEANPVRGPMPAASDAAAAPPREAAGPQPTGKGGAGLRWSAAWGRIGARVKPAVDRGRAGAGAVVPLVGAVVGLGLARLAGGLWALRIGRARGRVVDDPGLRADLDAVRAAMGCGCAVEVRELAGLGSPALAGWRRPAILLPDDWRAWEPADRRAVLAHEVAHVVRGDFAAGLLAHLAAAVHAQHPAVRWLAARMEEDQEVAADALAAPAAGGRAAYRVALARMALRQEARPPSWPARAFLPRRGALIRRIAMLTRDEAVTTRGEGWIGTRPGKALAAAALAGLTLAVGTLRAPARADDRPKSAAAVAAPGIDLAADPGPAFPGEGMDGVLAIRPAALVRRAGSLAGTLDEFLLAELQALLFEEAAKAGGDPRRDGPALLRAQDVEWLAVGFSLDQGAKPRDPLRKMHQLVFDGLAIRLVAPLDAADFLRRMKLPIAEHREGDRTLFVGELMRVPFAMAQLNDRTVIAGSEPRVRAALSGSYRAPAWLDGPDWERAKRGPAALVLANPGGEFARRYDLGRPDDAVVLSMLRGVERWTFGVDDADPIRLHGVARAGDDSAAATLAATMAGLRQLGLAGLAAKAGPTRPEAWARGFLDHLETRAEGSSLRLDAGSFGTFADVGDMLNAIEAEDDARDEMNRKVDDLGAILDEVGPPGDPGRKVPARSKVPAAPPAPLRPGP